MLNPLISLQDSSENIIHTIKGGRNTKTISVDFISYIENIKEIRSEIIVWFCLLMIVSQHKTVMGGKWIYRLLMACLMGPYTVVWIDKLR